MERTSIARWHDKGQLRHCLVLQTILEHNSDREVGPKVQQLFPRVVLRLLACVRPTAITPRCFRKSRRWTEPKTSLLSSEEMFATVWCVWARRETQCFCDTEAKQCLTSTYHHSGCRHDTQNLGRRRGTFAPLRGYHETHQQEPNNIPEDRRDQRAPTHVVPLWASWLNSACFHTRHLSFCIAPLLNST